MDVMKRTLVLFLALINCASCGLFSDLRKRTFTYTQDSVEQTLRIRVPKKYAKRESFVDSAGNQQQYFRYSNGALLYMVHTTDTLMQFQSVDTVNNIPKLYYNGALMYKGLDSSGLFWREIRTDSFRFGYRFVPNDKEILFDTAVNYAGMQRFKK
jgi:hypothetical protein